MKDDFSTLGTASWRGGGISTLAVTVVTLDFPCPENTPDIEPEISPYPGDVGDAMRDLLDCDEREPEEVTLW